MKKNTFELLGKKVTINEQGAYVLQLDGASIEFPQVEQALQFIEDQLLSEGNV